MDTQRETAYNELIDQLLTGDAGKVIEILLEKTELLDANLVEKMQLSVKFLEQNGDIK